MPKQKKRGDSDLPTSPEGWKIVRRKRFRVSARLPSPLIKLPKHQVDSLRALIGEASFNRMSNIHLIGVTAEFGNAVSAQERMHQLRELGFAADMQREDELEVVTPTGPLDTIYETPEGYQNFIKRLMRMGVVMEDAPSEG